MEQTEKNPELFLQKIEDFSLTNERGRWDVESANNMTGLMIGALESGASEDAVRTSVRVFEAKRSKMSPIVVSNLINKQRSGNLDISHDFLIKLSGPNEPSGVSFSSQTKLKLGPDTSNHEKKLFDIEFGLRRTKFKKETTVDLHDRDNLALNIVSALETGATQDEVLSSVLRLKLRNPDIQLTTENGRDFTDVLQSLAAEREKIPSSAPLPAEFIDGLRDAANAPANGSMTQRAFIDSSSKSVPMSGGIIQSLSPETYAGIHHAAANLKMGILTTLSGGKAEALGFDPDRYTMAGRASELENDGMA